MDKVTDFLKSLLSRKFLLAVAGAYVAYTAAIADGVISQAEVTAILAPILAYIGIEGAGDVVARYKNGN